MPSGIGMHSVGRVNVRCGDNNLHFNKLTNFGRGLRFMLFNNTTYYISHTANGAVGQSQASGISRAIRRRT